MDTSDETVLEALNDLGGLLEEVKTLDTSLESVFGPIKAQLQAKLEVASIVEDLQDGSVQSLINAKERVGEVFEDLIKQKLAEV